MQRALSKADYLLQCVSNMLIVISALKCPDFSGAPRLGWLSDTMDVVERQPAGAQMRQEAAGVVRVLIRQVCKLRYTQQLPPRTALQPQISFGDM